MTQIEGDARGSQRKRKARGEEEVGSGASGRDGAWLQPSPRRWRPHAAFPLPLSGPVKGPMAESPVIIKG